MALPGTREAGLSVDGLAGSRLGVEARLSSWRWPTTWRWELAEYPGWLAVQKADFILGPIGVGLYWCRRRPGNRLGVLLVVLGLLGVIYILQSSTVPALFGIGLLCEFAIGWWTLIVILAFPSGRLEGLIPRLLAGVEERITLRILPSMSPCQMPPPRLKRLASRDHPIWMMTARALDETPRGAMRDRTGRRTPASA